MKKNKFSPMLAPNKEIDLKQLPYPLLASYKLDGIRGIIREGQILTRSLKSIPNKQVRDKFQELVNFTKTEPILNPILDGEFLARSLEFTELSGTIRALDRIIPDDLYFYIFDTVADNAYDEPFIIRAERAQKFANLFPHLIKYVNQVIVKSPAEAQVYFEEAIAWGCDGIILRKPDGKYKCGRGTLKEGLIYKLKPFLTFEAKIIGVGQATKVDPKAEKKINELGYSVTSKKKGDRILIEKASEFIVKYGDQEVNPTLAMTDQEKEEVWRNRDKYIGRWIEYKGLLVGAKDAPRHPVFLRFRDDKDV